MSGPWEQLYLCCNHISLSSNKEKLVPFVPVFSLVHKGLNGKVVHNDVNGKVEFLGKQGVCRGQHPVETH